MYLKTQIVKLIFVITVCTLSGCVNTPEKGIKENTTILRDSSAKEISAEIEKDPQNAELYYRRACIYFNEKYLARALTDIDEATRLDDKNPIYYYQKGRIQYGMNKTMDAEKSYLSAIALKEDYFEAKMKLAELYYIVKKHTESINILNTVIVGDPGNAEAHFFKGMNLKETGDTLKAIAAFQHALEADKDFYDAAIQLGIIYTAKNDKYAFDYLASAIRMQPRNPEAWFARAYYFQKLGQYQKALFDYRKVIDLNPSNDIAYYNVGYINYEVKQYKEAIRAWNICIRMNNNNIDAYYMRGLVNELMGSKEEAQINYRYVLQLNPNHKLARERLALLK